MTRVIVMSLLTDTELSAANFGMPQSRKRVFIMMVRQDLASKRQLDAVAAWVRYAFPLSGRSYLKDISDYFQQVLHSRDEMEPHYPPKSKDPITVIASLPGLIPKFP